MLKEVAACAYKSAQVTSKSPRNFTLHFNVKKFEARFFHGSGFLGSPNDVNCQEESVSEEFTKKKPLYPLKKLVSNYLERTDPILDYGSIYKKYPNAKTSLIGKAPEKRFVWDEQDCTETFPSTPEKANLDIVNYLEQKDMWERRKHLHVPEFCVGSIIAVTRADRFAPKGWTRFVGLCVNKNASQNNKGANFILRNVLQGEALEIQYPTYSPLIQKIEVLKHQRWENEMPGVGLRFLRDFPLEYSTVDPNMQAEEYTDTPSLRLWTEEDKQKIIEWFDMIYESRRRR